MNETIGKQISKPAVYISLSRLFPLPILVSIVFLGSWLAGGVNWNTLIAEFGALLCMIAGHWYNSWADYRTGVDSGRPRSVPKVYAGGSGVLPLGYAGTREVLIGSIIAYAVFSAITVWLALTLGTIWFLFPWFFGVSAGIAYSHGFRKVLKGRGLKALGFPEYTGLLGFGVGGLSYGYLAFAGEVDILCFFFIGIVASLPFSVAWIADQYQDAHSDIKKGVKNLGTVTWLAGTGMATPFAFGVALCFMTLLLAIFVGYLSPWTFLAIFSAPLWLLSFVWIDKEMSKGVSYGLLAIFVYDVLLVVGQVIGG